nr:NIPSNAP family protein [Corallococcus exercitus]
MPSQSACCSVLELRQYTLHPGQREVLLSLFERAFVESQEAAGMHLIGQFRDEDRPDRFVWMRGFRDMASRRDALSAFYGGPVWKEHRDAANATMLDSDNVLLLRPVRPDTGLVHPGTPRPPPGAVARPDSRVEVTLCYLKARPMKPSRPPSSSTCAPCSRSWAPRPEPCSRPSPRRTPSLPCPCAGVSRSSPGSPCSRMPGSTASTFDAGPLRRPGWSRSSRGCTRRPNT